MLAFGEVCSSFLVQFGSCPDKKFGTGDKVLIVSVLIISVQLAPMIL